MFSRLQKHDLVLNALRATYLHSRHVPELNTARELTRRFQLARSTPRLRPMLADRMRDHVQHKEGCVRLHVLASLVPREASL